MGRIADLVHVSDFAWAAGLFEGEGCITISGGAPRLKLNSTDQDVVERFYGIVGLGQVREERTYARGWKRQWEWYTGAGESVSSVLELLMPYFGARRYGRAKEIVRRLRERGVDTTWYERDEELP